MMCRLDHGKRLVELIWRYREDSVKAMWILCDTLISRMSLLRMPRLSRSVGIAFVEKNFSLMGPSTNKKPETDFRFCDDVFWVGWFTSVFPRQRTNVLRVELFDHDHDQFRNFLSILNLSSHHSLVLRFSISISISSRLTISMVPNCLFPDWTP